MGPSATGHTYCANSATSARTDPDARAAVETATPSGPD